MHSLFSFNFHPDESKEATAQKLQFHKVHQVDTYVKLGMCISAQLIIGPLALEYKTLIEDSMDLISRENLFQYVLMTVSFRALVS